MSSCRQRSKYNNSGEFYVSVQVEFDSAVSPTMRIANLEATSYYAIL